MIGGQWCGCFALWSVCRAVALLVCWFVGLSGLGALLRSAPVQGVSRPPHAASRDCRTAHPLPVRTRVRLHRNAGSRGKGKRLAGKEAGRTMQPRSKRHPVFTVCAPTRSAASRDGMAGWAREGGGRFGERREYEAPTLPSTPRQHGMARHHKNQARNGSRPHTPAEKRPHHHNTSPPVPHSSVRSCHSSGNSTTSSILRR